MFLAIMASISNSLITFFYSKIFFKSMIYECRREKYIRQKRITATNLHMLGTRIHDSISVFELTETIGVGRTSFYHNYESKKDLLVEEEKRLFKESK